MCQYEESCGLIIVSSLEDSSHMKPVMWIFCTALPHSVTSSDPVIRRGRRAQMEHFALICVFIYVCLCWDYAAVEGCQWARATLSYIVHLLRCIFPSLCPHRLFLSLSCSTLWMKRVLHIHLNTCCSLWNLHQKTTVPLMATRGRLPLANLHWLYIKNEPQWHHSLVLVFSPFGREREVIG